VAEGARVESLDVLRGFALLGILLLNIVGFGLVSAAYSNPLLGITDTLDAYVWAGVDVLAEGAMRCLFSVLFGAGVVLFTADNRRSGALHYKRNLWLLAFGMFDAYVLLWSGDILVNYALAGAVLYLARDARPGRLLAAAALLIVMMSALYGLTQWGLGNAREAAATLAQSAEVESSVADAALAERASAWLDFDNDFSPEPAEQAEELRLRRESYAHAFRWNLGVTTQMLTFALPVVLFWDALAMMLLGMALYKFGVLQGDRTKRFYVTLMVAGFVTGFGVNATEVGTAWRSDFDLLSAFAQAQPTYHVGRLAMAMGYLGLIMLIIRAGALQAWRVRLAAVGRMALTNYLMHSAICLFVFTGAGMSLVGELSRWQLYGVVIAIWVVQLILSPWWLRRFRFGPAEWVWRALTYGELPKLRRDLNPNRLTL